MSENRQKQIMDKITIMLEENLPKSVIVKIQIEAFKNSRCLLHHKGNILFCAEPIEFSNIQKEFDLVEVVKDSIKIYEIFSNINGKVTDFYTIEKFEYIQKIRDTLETCLQLVNGKIKTAKIIDYYR